MKNLSLFSLLAASLINSSAFAIGNVYFVNNGSVVSTPATQVVYRVSAKNAEGWTRKISIEGKVQLSTGVISFPSNSVDTFDVYIGAITENKVSEMHPCAMAVKYKENKDLGDVVIYGWVNRMDTNKWGCAITYGEPSKLKVGLMGILFSTNVIHWGIE